MLKALDSHIHLFHSVFNEYLLSTQYQSRTVSALEIEQENYIFASWSLFRKIGNKAQNLLNGTSVGSNIISEINVKSSIILRMI